MPKKKRWNFYKLMAKKSAKFYKRLRRPSDQKRNVV